MNIAKLMLFFLTRTLSAILVIRGGSMAFG